MAGLASRIPALDALRGLAILAMVTYHFCFDLQYFGVTHWDFYHDSFWLNARTMILSSFLLIAGMSRVRAISRNDESIIVRALSQKESG